MLGRYGVLEARNRSIVKLGLQPMSECDLPFCKILRTPPVAQFSPPCFCARFPMRGSRVGEAVCCACGSCVRDLATPGRCFSWSFPAGV